VFEQRFILTRNGEALETWNRAKLGEAAMAEPAAPGIADWEWIASLDRTIEAGHAWPDSSITWASVAGNANQPDE
jgi:hypothetical protein